MSVHVALPLVREMHAGDLPGEAGSAARRLSEDWANRGTRSIMGMVPGKQ